MTNQTITLDGVEKPTEVELPKHILKLMNTLGDTMQCSKRDDNDCEKIYALYNYLGKKYINTNRSN